MKLPIFNHFQLIKMEKKKKRQFIVLTWHVILEALKSTWVLVTVKFTFIVATFREGNGNPLQYSCLENPMDRGAW